MYSCTAPAVKTPASVTAAQEEEVMDWRRTWEASGRNWSRRSHRRKLTRYQPSSRTSSSRSMSTRPAAMLAKCLVVLSRGWHQHPESAALSASVSCLADSRCEQSLWKDSKKSLGQILPWHIKSWRRDFFLIVVTPFSRRFLGPLFFKMQMQRRLNWRNSRELPFQMHLKCWWANITDQILLDSVVWISTFF